MRGLLPDRDVPSQLDGLPVLQTLHSADGSRRALIVDAGDGTLRMRVQAWCVADAEFTGTGDWRDRDAGAIVVDAVERAMPLARELLAQPL